MALALLWARVQGLSGGRGGCASYECRFSEYVRQNGVRFVSPLEKVFRFEVFKKNLREVQTFNEAHPEVQLNLNDFGLLTREEFRRSMTNPDFLFVDEAGRRHHVNVNDPRNEEVIDQKILDTNAEALSAIQSEVEHQGKGNPLLLLEWDIENADKAVHLEMERLHDFLREHEARLVDRTELLDADGCESSSIQFRNL